MATHIGQAGAWVGSRIRQYSNLKGSGIQGKSAKEHLSFFPCYCCLFAVSFFFSSSSPFLSVAKFMERTISTKKFTCWPCKDKGQGSRVSTGSLAYEILRGICKGYPGFFFSSISICSVFIYLPLVFHYLALLLPYFFLFSPKKSKKNKNKSLCFHVSSASTYASTKTWSAVVTFALRTFSPELSIEKTNGGNDETDRLRKILGGPRG
nr:hypothetical protein B21J21.300 [imported] - Neurospora crassa [Neurospora crassa]